MKVVINKCFGGFRLSNEAYEMLIDIGIPVKQYKQQVKNPVTGLYEKDLENEGKVIFDRDLNDNPSKLDKPMRHPSGRYWDTWMKNNRDNLDLVKVVENLGDKASDKHAQLRVIEIPDGVEYEIEEYDGLEHIAESHRTWA